MRRFFAPAMALCWALSCPLVGCARQDVLQTALHGDLATLKRQIAEQQRRGDLDRDDVEELAAAVAGRELRSANGPTAVRRIRSLRACAMPLLPVLEDRAQRSDDAAAEATLVLLELGKLDKSDLVSRHAESSSGAWRAVAARAAVDRRHGTLRRRLILDTDERARRGALAAAIEARDAADLDELLETARLDPDPMCRSLSVRAVGAIGGERAVLGLDDRWVRADEATRLTIVDAWSMPASYKTGGERKLVSIAESSKGLPAIAAADALVRLGGPSSELGATLLARAINEGTEPERRLAIQVAPPADSDVKKAIQKAAKSDDRQVRVMALARLLDDSEKPMAVAALRALAKGKDDIAIQARAALAAARDSSVNSGLMSQLGAPIAEHRRLAALGLIRLGDYAKAATGLADDDPEVRTSVACSVLSEARAVLR